MDKSSSENKNISLKEPKIYQEIKQQLRKSFPNDFLLKITYIQSIDFNELLIKLKFRRNTSYNNQLIDIHFFISLDCYFPESPPCIKCMTNFSQPSLFDGRNLLYSVIHQNWTKESTIIDIVEKIPELISRVIENYNNKILVYYGDYQIDKVYDMNELILNKELHFFRIYQRIRKNKKIYSKQRYIVLTDVYFLLFDPISESRNQGRLLFWGDIRQISSSKTTEISSEYLFLEWKNEEDRVVVNFEIEFCEKSSIGDFMKKTNYKIAKLKENFKIFQDDINKPSSEEDQYLTQDKLELLIKYKEDLLKKKYSVNLVKELMNLYQKIIEVLSANNDMSFATYLEKLHKMLQIQHVDNSFHANSQNSTQSSSRNSFRLSYNAFSSFNESVDNQNN